MKRCNQCWKRKPRKAFINKRGHECQDCGPCRRARRGGYVPKGRHPDLDTPGEIRILWHASSHVQKLGGMPASSSSGHTCPDACTLKGRGCYAEHGFGGAWWRALSSGKAPPRGRGPDKRGPIGITWAAFLEEVRALPRGTMWRHNLAGDLPGHGDAVNVDRLVELVVANGGRRGFTFTHKPAHKYRRVFEAVRESNAHGFAVNLSADSPHEADALAELEAGPVVAVVPHDAPSRLETPRGRPVRVCPAQLSKRATCASCGWCARIDRPWIVGFRAHGQAKKAISLRVLS